jgi:hypothetical protein
MEYPGWAYTEAHFPPAVRDELQRFWMCNGVIFPRNETAALRVNLLRNLHGPFRPIDRHKRGGDTDGSRSNFL